MPGVVSVVLNVFPQRSGMEWVERKKKQVDEHTRSKYHFAVFLVLIRPLGRRTSKDRDSLRATPNPACIHPDPGCGCCCSLLETEK